MKVVKFVSAVVLCIILGLGVVYCVNHVGDLNRNAVALEACVKSGTEAQQAKDCPNRPGSDAKANSFHHEATTFGQLGWIAFLFLVFGIGGTVYDNLKN